MDESKLLDKIKMQELLDELVNLKRYSNDLSNCTKGEKIELYIGELTKNINLLNNEVEEIYEKTFKTID